MKDKVFSVLCVLLVLAILAVPVSAENTRNTVNDASDIVDGILDWNLTAAGTDDIQTWIDGVLTQNAGTISEWYILTLSQSGDYDFSAYEKALTDYLGSNTIRSASSRLKYALVLRAVGSESGYIVEFLDASIGQQGIMSWVYGLHLISNGVPCAEYTADDVIGILLDLQHDDGGWSLTGDFGDTDVSAMTVQALAPYYQVNESVKSAVDEAIMFLSSRQQDDGGYTSYGVPNPESTSQVLVAMSSLGIDCAEDERFLKNGSTLIDGIMNFRLSDGSFCHKTGEGSNHTATVQAYYSMIAYLRMTEGKTPLYVLADDPVSEPEPVEEAVDVPTVPEESEEEAPVIEETEKTAPETVTETEAETQEIIVPPADEVHKYTGESADSIGYKSVVCVILVGLGAAACLIFFALGKRHKKNYLAIAVLTGIGILIVLLTDFQSADDYYSGHAAEKTNSIGTVTLTIRCDTIVGKSDSEYIPDDGIILATTEFAIEEGDSVFDILNEAAQTYHIQMENAGQWDMIYIAGINYLYEFDFGDLSGWIYHVNGSAPSVGCGEYVLKDGDRIEWLYTCDLGNDLREGN